MQQAERVHNHPYVYRVEQVARLWGCSSHHVRALINRGELKAMRIGRLIRIRPEWVKEYEECASSNSGVATTHTGEKASNPNVSRFEPVIQM